MGWTEAPAVKRRPPGKRPLPSPLATAPRLDSTGIQRLSHLSKGIPSAKLTESQRFTRCSPAARPTPREAVGSEPTAKCNWDGYLFLTLCRSTPLLLTFPGVSRFPPLLPDVAGPTRLACPGGPKHRKPHDHHDTPPVTSRIINIGRPSTICTRQTNQNTRALLRWRLFASSSSAALIQRSRIVPCSGMAPPLTTCQTTSDPKKRLRGRSTPMAYHRASRKPIDTPTPAVLHRSIGRPHATTKRHSRCRILTQQPSMASTFWRILSKPSRIP